MISEISLSLSVVHPFMAAVTAAAVPEVLIGTYRGVGTRILQKPSSTMDTRKDKNIRLKLKP